MPSSISLASWTTFSCDTYQLQLDKLQLPLETQNVLGLKASSFACHSHSVMVAGSGTDPITSLAEKREFSGHWWLREKGLEFSNTL